MAKISLSLLFLLFSFLCISGTAESAVAKRSSSATDFIKASCGSTRYPALCVQCLSTYANTIQQSPKQLAQAALNVSLTRARSVTTYVIKMTKVKGLKGREIQAVKDCVDEMGDTVDRLSRSVKELGNMGRAGSQSFMWHMSNVQTWVSAALTDESTCSDGFAGHAMDGNVKAAIRGRIVDVAQVTSNALALINRFAEKHKS